jgi:TIR domain
MQEGLVQRVSLPHHVFISYSRQDAEIAGRIREALHDAGISVWSDSDVIPGTPNYEQAIRTSIKDAIAVVLVASPNSAQSAFVAGEVAIAQSHNVPVYPVWIAGSDWAGSASLRFSLTEYIDVRGTEWDWGLHLLQNTLNNLKDAVLPRFFLHRIGLPVPVTEYLMIRRGDEGIAIRFRPYKTVLDLINDIYIHFLQGRHLSTGEEFAAAYGSQWILAPSPIDPAISENIIQAPVPYSGYTHWRPPRKLLAPWSWLTNSDRSAPIASYDRAWYERPLRESGILQTTAWDIIEYPYSREQEIVVGIAGPDPLSDTNPRYLYSLFCHEVHRDSSGLRVVDPATVPTASPTAVYLIERMWGWPAVDWQSFNLMALITSEWNHRW